MKRLWLFGLLIFNVSHAQQNLVMNPGFEEIDECPTISAFLNSGHVSGWSGPSTELYTQRMDCTNSYYDLIENYAGTQTIASPLSGDNYAGVRVSSSSGGYRERIYGTLIEPVIPGIRYEFSYRVSLAESSNAASSGMGLGFTDALITTPTFLNGPLPPLSARSFQNSLVTDMNGWTTISGSLVATQAASHIVVGGMTDAAIWTTLSASLSNNSYYFLDDVSITCEPEYSFSVTAHPACDQLPNVTVTSGNAAFARWTLTTPSGQTFVSEQFIGNQMVPITALFPEELLEEEGTYQLSVQASCRSPDYIEFGTHTFEIRRTPEAPSPPTFTSYAGADPATYVSAPFSIHEGVNTLIEGSASIAGLYTAPNGCSTPVMIPFQVLPPTPEMRAAALETFYLPNSFSPNGDGVNEAWFPKGQNVDFEIQVFDRWGTMIYQTGRKPIESASENPWFGEIRGGQHTLDGTYTYIARYWGRTSAHAKELTGFVQVLR
jgi:gliding motility-associated-like protein